MRDEIKKHIIDPNPDESLNNLLNINTVYNLNYLGYCLNESLRIEPPVPSSSSLTVTEDTRLGPYLIKKDHIFTLDIWRAHHNPEQWQDPDSFIPERFDP